ncbi:hypothetical protein BDZ97DRAFT_1837445 [Flammula alnicola]|nr:hypothetical protein BDZ97DRAFT_1837445 [Flammula alnicola]
MMTLRIGYVREHFSSPLLQFAEADAGKTFTLVECPSVALTDPLISGIANGSKAYKLVGSFVATPLNWAVITGTKSKFNSISDLKGTTLGISRNGSGSQTMAYVMALQQGWPTEDLKFQINNDIRGLINSVNDGTTSAFMWEWFTTKPFVDAGEARFIGSVPTPWPSCRQRILGGLTTYVTEFNSEESRAKKNVGLLRRSLVSYPKSCSEIPMKVVLDTLG